MVQGDPEAVANGPFPKNNTWNCFFFPFLGPTILAADTHVTYFNDFFCRVIMTRDAIEGSKRPLIPGMTLLLLQHVWLSHPEDSLGALLVFLVPVGLKSR